jgi:uncharacterized protein GlcG (DUF336 family)
MYYLKFFCTFFTNFKFFLTLFLPFFSVILIIERMDKAFVTSIDIAINKAFTAWALKKGTNEISEDVLPGQSLYGLNTTNNCRIITFGGGFPIVINGEIVGAVGVSGGTVEEDMSIAKAGLSAL